MATRSPRSSPRRRKKPRIDEARADRAVAFFERVLVHTKGRWAGLPFKLADWQRDDIIRPLFGTLNADGTRRYRTAYVEMGRKNGKALALDTPLPTPGGWTTMADVKVGDVLFNEHGEPCSVTAVGPVQLGRPCYELVFSDGTRIIADAEHEWYVESRRNGAAPAGRRAGAGHIRTTAELSDTLLVPRRDRTCERNHTIPLAGALRCPEANLPVHPYVLGVWLGDGRSDAASVTCAYGDYEVIARINACGVETHDYNAKASCTSGHFRLGDGDRTQAARNVSVQARLRALGVLGDKQIPASYLRASTRQRRELLRGLMDSDGYVNKAGQCEFTTTSLRLAEDFCELCRSLGYKPQVKEARAMLRGVDCGPKYRIQFWAWADEPCFHLARKCERLKRRPASRTRSMTRQIVSCREVPSVPVRCISVDSASRLYLAGEGMVPTHNSELAAGIALYCLVADAEEGAEVYGAASDRDQATIVFHVAADMVRRSPWLSSTCKIIDSQKRIIVPATGSVYRAIPADAAGAHGYNAHAVIIDELHAQPNRELVDVLTTSTAAREQPLVFAITTAGYDRTSICWEWHEYAERVLKGTVDDPTFFAYIRALPEDADWTDESLWHLANPALEGCGGGDFRGREELRTAVHQAQERPALENTIRRLYFSQWTQADVRWFSLGAWDACGGLLHEAEWAGRPAFGGLDLSSTSDLTAFVLVLPRDDGGYDVLTRCWLPEAALEKRAPMRPQLEAWARGGFLEITPGDAVDYAWIKRRVLQDCATYAVREIGYDPWSATQVAIQLNEESGNPDLMVPVRQGFRTLSAPSKLLETLVAKRQLNHGGHPVMRWCADNVVIETDPTDAIKPSKRKSSEKVDCIVALVTALERASAYTEPAQVQFYAFDS